MFKSPGPIPVCGIFAEHFHHIRQKKIPGSGFPSYFSSVSKDITQGWRGDSVIKNARCSSRGPGLDSQHQQCSLQLVVTPFHQL